MANDVKILKLITGEEVIARVTEEENNLNVVFTLNADVTYISDCTNLNTSNEIYYLNTSITNTNNKVCMNISADNVTLDCQGYTIDGDDSVDSWGIFAYLVSDVNIKNCSVSDFADGIRMNFVNGGIINNTLTKSNRKRGIYLKYANNLIL